MIAGEVDANIDIVAAVAAADSDSGADAAAAVDQSKSVFDQHLNQPQHQQQHHRAGAYKNIIDELERKYCSSQVSQSVSQSVTTVIFAMLLFQVPALAYMRDDI